MSLENRDCRGPSETWPRDSQWSCRRLAWNGTVYGIDMVAESIQPAQLAPRLASRSRRPIILELLSSGQPTTSLSGEPSSDKPWGWQLDGHHVVINYFVLGDQVVMTPVFMGSEPVRAESGKFQGKATGRAACSTDLNFAAFTSKPLRPGLIRID